MAYVLGFFAADGSMLENSRGGHYIEFNSTDRILLEHIKRVTQAHQKITKRDRDARDAPTWKTIYRLQIGSKEWFRDLESLGFTQHKSNTLHFPEVPGEYLGHFVRGYFDGDGCVYFNYLKYQDRTHKRWVLLTLFTSGSRPFLKSLHAALKGLGVAGGSLTNKKRGFELKFSHSDSLALYRLMYHTAEVCEVFLPRKREKLERAIQVLGIDK
jgi:intein/homing endonuclease